MPAVVRPWPAKAVVPPKFTSDAFIKPVPESRTKLPLELIWAASMPVPAAIRSVPLLSMLVVVNLPPAVMSVSAPEFVVKFPAMRTVLLNT